MSTIINSWRVTKYNPKYRDKYGNYLIKNDWTSYSDIGKMINGKIFSYYDYLQVEQRYVKVIMNFMRFLQLGNLSVSSLELNEVQYQKEEEKIQRFLKSPYNINDKFDYAFALHPLYRNLLRDMPNAITEGMTLREPEIMAVSSLILRDVFWCKLVSKTNLQIHFGFDYYMYIVSDQDCSALISILKRESNLYIEEHPSPYIDVD